MTIDRQQSAAATDVLAVVVMGLVFVALIAAITAAVTDDTRTRYRRAPCSEWAGEHPGDLPARCLPAWPDSGETTN
jgi:hypothetical protein